MFRSHLCRLIALAAVSVWLPSALRADDSPSPVEAAPSDRIEQWIKQLDANQFAQRTEASRNLEAAGKAAFGALAEAATGGSREASIRAIEILRKHFQDGDEATKEAAKLALEKIAGSGQEPVAGRAKEALQPKPAQLPAIVPGNVFMPQIQIRMNAAAGGKTRSMSINNGVKTIEVSETGKKIKITDDPAKGIEMEVTETKDGKETTQKYAAKNAEELKKNHPEAYKLYLENAKEGAGIQIQAGGIQIQGFGNAIPLQAIPVPVAPQIERARRPLAATLLQNAQRMIEMSAKQLQAEKEAGAENAKRLEEPLKQLEEIQKQLKAVQDKLSEG